MIRSILVSGEDRNLGRLGCPMVKVSTGLETGKTKEKVIFFYIITIILIYLLLLLLLFPQLSHIE